MFSISQSLSVGLHIYLTLAPWYWYSNIKNMFWQTASPTPMDLIQAQQKFLRYITVIKVLLNGWTNTT